MKVDAPVAEVRVQLELMRETVSELAWQRTRHSDGPGSRLEVAGFGALLMNIYAGVENILKRIAQAEGVLPPTGERWHAELFNRLCTDLPSTGEPFLQESEAETLRELRNFRHVMVHTYGVCLKWELMAHLVADIEAAYDAIIAGAIRYFEVTAPGSASELEVLRRPWGEKT